MSASPPPLHKGIIGFLTTVPGILTGLATLIGAVTSLIVALNATGFFNSAPPAPSTLVPMTIAATPTALVFEPPVQTAAIATPTSMPPTPAPRVDLAGRWEHNPGFTVLSGSGPQYNFEVYADQFNPPIGTGIASFVDGQLFMDCFAGGRCGELSILDEHRMQGYYLIFGSTVQVFLERKP